MEQLVEFVALLRRAGFSVGSDELIALTKSSQFFDPACHSFKHVLRSFLIKDQRDFAFFDLLFTSHFQYGKANPEMDVQECLQELDLMEEFGGSADGKGLAAAATGGKGSKLAHLLRIGDYSQAKKHLQVALSSLNPGEASGQELLDQAKLLVDWHMEHYRLEKLAKEVDLIEAVKWEEEWRNLEQQLHRGIATILLKRNKPEDMDELKTLFNYKQKNLGRLTPGELLDMKREVINLGRRLATRRNRQWKKSNRGSIDLKRTLRNSLPGQGVPMKLCYRRHKISRPNLLLLCDVSSSVVQYTAFMLLLVYSMEQSFRKVRSFIFVDQLEEISPYFERYGFETAIEKLVTRATCSTSGFSDFGRVFTTFENDYLHLLTPKTDVIILGDGRNNYHQPGTEGLAAISRSCRNLWWLNPQPKQFWDKDDSIVSQYAAYCTFVWECSNLEQLRTIAQVICR